MRFTFIHAADLHIDSPLAGLGVKDAAVAERFFKAGRTAVESLVAEAVDSKAAFLIVAGDVFDGDWKDVPTGHFFVRALGKLHRAGIRTVLVKGNHDADSIMSRSLRYPDSVRTFASHKAESFVIDEHRVVLHGRSFGGRKVADDFIASYPKRHEGRLNIGVLHTALDGRPGHESYAPCTIEDLRRFGYDYWALGHIHAAETVSTDPWIVYPGNLQGRSVRELGPKGAMRVTVEDGRIVEATPLVLDAARWAHETLDVSACADEAAVLDVIRAGLTALHPTTEGRPLAVRITLTGTTPAHAMLVARRETIEEEARALGFQFAEDCWVEQVKIRTTAPARLVTASSEADALDVEALLAAAAADPDFAGALAELMASVAEKLPRDLRGEVGADDPAAPGRLAALARDYLAGAGPVRIERLTLERYGAFSDRTLTFRPGASLHVVLGANEAGKTSALAAITDLLFGFRHLTPYDFRHDTRALRIGGAFRRGDGGALVLRRRKGTKNTLVDAADQPLADDPLAPLLGGITRETFESEFGLTAQALRDGGNELLKAGGRLAETLAASSAGLTALSREGRRLGDEADALFTPRKSAGKSFYVAAERHAEAERRLRDAIVTADAMAASDAAVEAAELRLNALTAEHAAAGSALARLQRAARTRPKLARLETLARDLAAFADLPEVAASAVAAWREALAEEARLAAEIDRLAAADAADAAAIATLAVDEAMLAAGGTIDALRERIGAVGKALADLPRRREARRLAQDALDDAARRLGLDSHATLLERLPTDPAIARVRELIAAGTRSAERRDEAAAQRRQALAERDRLAAASGAAAVDPEPFRQRLESLAEVPTDADHLRREGASCDAEDRSLAEAAAALDPAAGGPDALAVLPLPDAETIAAQVAIAAAVGHEVEAAQATLKQADKEIEAAAAEVARLSRDGAAATRTDLSAARGERDGGFETLRAALDGTAGDRRAAFEAARSLSGAVDAVTDRLLADTERAARRDTAEERLAAARETRHGAATAVAELAARRAETEAAWEALWTASGIVPRPPGEMARWRDRVLAIRERRGRLAERRAELAAVAARLDGSRIALAALLAEHGRAAAEAVSAELLYREARLRLDGMQGAWAEAAARTVARQRAERDLAEAEAALERAEVALAEHAVAWPAAVTAIGLAATASLAEAEAALTVWQGVAMPRQSFEREGRSVAGIERDLAAFDADVTAVVAAAAPDLDGDAQAVLQQLTARLGEARRAADRRAHLRHAAAARGTARPALAAQRDAAAAILAQAGKALGTESAALGPVLDRMTQRQALALEQQAAARDIAEIADGLDEAALRDEQAGVDGDLLPGEIERLGLRQSQLLAEIAEASAALHEAKSDRDTLAQGRDAAAAARERAEAGAELLSIAERWIVRAAAARLATRAIERHRAAVQDPLIERAGALFAVATAQAFAGLGADYDDADRPVLVARRADASRVPVGGLSEGTRDQLFLALRLALLERRTAETLPFIGDDLLASFDEARTARTLSLLAEFGRERQVVLFTHHRHVAELAKAMPGGASDVIDL